MKKIMSFIAIASVAASLFAAEPDIAMKFRSRMNFLNFTKTKTEAEVGKIKIVDKYKNLDWINLSGYGKPSDVFDFTAKSDKFGVQLALDLNAIAASGIDSINTYNGWMKFGNLKLMAGTWREGVYDDRFRVCEDSDDAGFLPRDFEACDFGGVFEGQNITFIDDVSNFKGNSSTLSFLGECPISIGDKMTLTLLGGFVSSPYMNYKYDPKVGEPEKDGKVVKVTTKNQTRNLESGFVGRVTFDIEDALGLQVIWKNAAVREHAFGVYVMPKIGDIVTLSVGGAFGLAPDYNDAGVQKIGNNPVLESWAADLRARFAINDKFSITTFNEVSGYTLNTGKKGQKINEGGTLSMTDFDGDETGDVNARIALWDEIGFRFKATEVFTVGLNAGILTALKAPEAGTLRADGYLEKGDAYDKFLMYRVTPYCQIFANDNTYINIGVAVYGNTMKVGDTKTNVIGVEVPVVFRIQL